eukprot:scaffold215996_cov32-Tisochrysis_lutea.AAC.1
MLAALAAVAASAATLVALRSGTSSARTRSDPPAASLALGATGEEALYSPPKWAPASLTPPKSRLRLAHLPTPIHRWPLPKVAEETEVWIKRDDMTGCELSGNKIRKLEFLLADAKAKGCDCVITVGGFQSNHCRATAAAARRVGLEPHIILRSDLEPGADPGMCGNLLVDRMVDAKIHFVSDAKFNAKGGWKLVCELREDLEEEGKTPYAFPSGGSNALGTWGYLEALREIMEQTESAGLAFDRIYFGCGSGGTAAGLALGVHLSGMRDAGTELVALGVDDSPDIFYDKLDGIFRSCFSDFTDVKSREILTILDCVGLGYAQATDEELRFALETARATGVCLDPVYTGKAALGMARDLRARPVKRALFIHTGGLLGTYAKAEQLQALLTAERS